MLNSFLQVFRIIIKNYFLQTKNEPISKVFQIYKQYTFLNNELIYFSVMYQLCIQIYVIFIIKKIIFFNMIYLRIQNYLI